MDSKSRKVIEKSMTSRGRQSALIRGLHCKHVVAPATTKFHHLKVWYRGPFEHNGSIATLEDWFDSRRLRDDYVPTGFSGGEARAIKGHTFGLGLSPGDRRALIAFLKTL